MNKLITYSKVVIIILVLSLTLGGCKGEENIQKVEDVVSNPEEIANSDKTLVKLES